MFKNFSLEKLPINTREVFIKNVDTMLKCKDPKDGCTTFQCPKCSMLHTVPFSCKSRLCPSCGKAYSENWVIRNQNKLLNCPHRQLVFTIPIEFRRVIYKNNILLRLLTTAISETINYHFYKQFKIVKPAFIVALHTFGRQLNFNPHFHVIIAEGGFKDDLSFKKVTYFPFDFFRLSWQKQFLDTIKTFFNTHDDKRKVFKLINEAYKNQNNGFYVYADGKINDTKRALKYIGRYLSRPPISLYNIIKYDGVYVTYRFHDHMSKKIETITLDAISFIGRIAYHTLPKGLQVISRFGGYARNLGKFKEVISSFSLPKTLSSHSKRISYRELAIKTFNFDPLCCKRFSTTLEIIAIWHPNYGCIYNLMASKSG